MTGEDYGEAAEWSPAAPEFRPLRLVLAWLVGAVAVSLAGLVLPGVSGKSFGAAVITAALVGVLNPVPPPPVLAQWIEKGTHGMLEWETDLSSQTGASQAGILLGSNDDIPAFRWIEKETGRLMTCSAPADCAELERRLIAGQGLLREGGASRGNLLSGEAEEVIITVSRIEAEKRGNAGYRAF